jgi:hypothetical protein
VERTREHLPEEILIITIAAVLSGANGWNEFEDYAHSKHAWFKSFLTRPSGIPSRDTFNRIALKLLKQDKTSKRGIHGKRLKAE